MDISLVNKLTNMKAKLEKEKEDQIRNQTMLDTCMKQLKEEYNCDTLEEAQELYTEVKKEIEKEEKELSQKIKELEQEIYHD